MKRRTNAKRGRTADSEAIALAKLIFSKPSPLPQGGRVNGLRLDYQNLRPKALLEALERIAKMDDAAAAAFFKRLAGVISRQDHREHGVDILALEVDRATRDGKKINASEFVHDGRAEDPKRIGRILKKLGRQPGRTGAPKKSGN